VSIGFAEKSIDTNSFYAFLKGPVPYYLPVSGHPLNELERVRCCRWLTMSEYLYMDSSSFASNLSMAVGSTAYVYPASSGGIR